MVKCTLYLWSPNAKSSVHERNILIAYFGARSKLKSHFYSEMIILILMDDTVSFQPAVQDQFYS